MLETLYRTHRNTMYHRAKSVLGDHSLSEDAVHEAFVRIARHIRRFETMPEEEQRYLCLTIVKNAALNLLRDRGGVLSLEEDLPAGTTDVSLAVDLERAIDALGEEHRQVVLLRLRFGFDTAQTARLLGIPGGTVRSRLNRARKLLRESLGAEDATNTKTMGVRNNETLLGP